MNLAVTLDFYRGRIAICFHENRPLAARVFKDNLVVCHNRMTDGIQYDCSIQLGNRASVVSSRHLACTRINNAVIANDHIVRIPDGDAINRRIDDGVVFDPETVHQPGVCRETCAGINRDGGVAGKAGDRRGGCRQSR